MSNQFDYDVGPRVGGLRSRRGQADKDRLAVGGDSPGGQHRLGRGVGMHAEV
jgi:hypothetical protein